MKIHLTHEEFQLLNRLARAQISYESAKRFAGPKVVACHQALQEAITEQINLRLPEGVDVDSFFSHDEHPDCAPAKLRPLRNKLDDLVKSLTDEEKRLISASDFGTITAYDDVRSCRFVVMLDDLGEKFVAAERKLVADYCEQGAPEPA